jgi:hypothetical protein
MRAPGLPSFARACLGLMLLAVAGRAVAIDGVFVAARPGNHVDIVGAGIASREWKRWPLGDGWSLSLHGVAGIALWEGATGTRRTGTLSTSTCTPVFRLDRGLASGVVPYLEASVGVNLLSSTRINDCREFSTAFPCGEFLGVGVAFGARRQYDLGLRVQHASIADIKFPNDGLTYDSIVFQYRFDMP